MRRKAIIAGLVLIAATLMVVGSLRPFSSRRPVLVLPGVVETHEIRLGSKVGGRVADISTVEGELVEPGQALVRFEAPELEAQHEQWQARLRSAEADLEKAKNGPRPQEKEAARAAVEAARARWQRLKAGWREEEVRQAKSELDSAEADLKLAREEWERVVRLYRQQTVPRSEYDSARATHDRAEARSRSARARLDMLVAGNRAEDIAEAAAVLEQAQANHDLLLAGTRPEDIAAAEARAAETRGKLREMEANLQETTVRAPARAIVEVLAVRKGDVVPPNAPVVRILRAEDLWVKVYVPETELGKLRLNQAVTVQTDAYPNKRLAGTIVQVASTSEFTPRNVQSVDERRHQVFGVKVHVTEPQGIFKSGMAAEVYVPLQEAR